MSSHEDSQNDVDLLSHAGEIFAPVKLPVSGRTVPNRLVKAPLYEHFCSLWDGNPNSALCALYAKWGAGHWGVIITGNVQVDRKHLSFGRDMTIPEVLSPAALAPWTRLAEAIHTGRASPLDAPHPEAAAHAELGTPLALIQLSHGGRQSLNVLGGRSPFEPPLAPSPIRSGASHAGKDGQLSLAIHKLMHQEPREMTHTDIKAAVAAFVRGAELASLSGFDGVQVHAAHGYLVCQFISPKSNIRTDDYSAQTDPLHFLRDIVYGIRESKIIPAHFVVAVKLNSADYTVDSTEPQESRALDHVREIGSWGLVDFIEVSGGDYEDPRTSPPLPFETSLLNVSAEFIDSVQQFKKPRQVMFEAFAERSMDVLAHCTPSATARGAPPLICLTGGLSTLPKMSSVLGHNHAHLLGIGRPAATHPSLPVELYEAVSARTAGRATDFFMTEPPALRADGLGEPPRTLLSWRALERFTFYVLSLLWSLQPARLPRLVGAGGDVNWHNIVMRRIAAGEKEPADYTLGKIGASVRFYFSPYPPSEGGASARWWMLAGVVGVAIGVGLGQVI
ncbi:NADPH dehydrogenase [Trametes pubescens]|uniref:NADPH dehydrogenase n=1 Tax=Trametes pubescens TaxID=154538 RepID=A0A1M2W678_TRAPU|nr:NADPH dehydrogenase [Trametes pubescens]